MTQRHENPAFGTHEHPDTAAFLAAGFSTDSAREIGQDDGVDRQGRIARIAAKIKAERNGTPGLGSTTGAWSQHFSALEAAEIAARQTSEISDTDGAVTPNAQPSFALVRPVLEGVVLDSGHETPSAHPHEQPAPTPETDDLDVPDFMK